MSDKLTRLFATALISILAFATCVPAQNQTPIPSPVGHYELRNHDGTPVEAGATWEVTIRQPVPLVPIFVDTVTRDTGAGPVEMPGESAIYWPTPTGFTYENGYGNTGDMEYCCLGIWRCTMTSGRNAGKQTLLTPTS